MNEIAAVIRAVRIQLDIHPSVTVLEASKISTLANRIHTRDILSRCSLNGVSTVQAIHTRGPTLLTF